MATHEQKMVAFVLYPGLTLLDLVGPLQVFASLRRFTDQYRPVVVAERIEPMPTDGPLRVTADRTFGDVPDPEVVVVPGGDAPTIKAMGDPAIRDYLRQVADTVPVVGSVCTGALVLAAAGLPEGARPPPTGPTTASWNAWAPGTWRSGGWRTASSSPPPGCRPASTWPWRWWPG
jgi:putative intracellular protease/amidase